MLWLKNIRSFARAVWSFIRYGDAPLVQVWEREKACMTCPELKVTLTNEFCKACGCPEWAVSDLRTKRRMRDMKCPKGKW